MVQNARLNLACKYFLGLAVDEDVPDDTTISHLRAKRLGEEKAQCAGGDTGVGPF